MSARLPQLLAGFADGAPDLDVRGLALDSRRVKAGDLFLACQGHAHHGLAFLDAARAKGAAAVAWEPAQGVSAPGKIPAVAVKNLGARAGEIAARFYAQPSRQLFGVGITGTDGKTSTAHLIAQALERLGTPCLYVGTLGTGRLGHFDEATHTTPDPVRLQEILAGAVQQGVRALAMEVSSHALDQDRIAGTELAVAVLTNVGRDHLDYHGTVENYAAAKRKLFARAGLKSVVLNRDDAHGAAWAREQKGDVVVYGIGGEAPRAGRYVLAENVKLSGEGLSFDVNSSAGRAALRTRLLGRFNVYNLLAALAVLLEKGVALNDAVAALAESRTVPGRIEGFRGAKAAPLVVVDYAHTPQALEQILSAVRPHCAGQLIVVFGCGGDRDRGKRPLMGAAAARHADRAIVTDDNPRSENPASITDAILAAMPADTPVIHDRAEAIARAVRGATVDDIVVVAGKGHETTQTYGQDVRAFSDRTFVADLVGATVH